MVSTVPCSPKPKDFHSCAIPVFERISLGLESFMTSFRLLIKAALSNPTLAIRAKVVYW